MHHQPQSPQPRRSVPPAVALPVMLITIGLVVALAVGTVLSQPAPVIIELAPEDFAATDGDRFTYDHNLKATLAPEARFE